MEVTRFDRNITENIFDFKLFQEDSTLVKNIVVFLAHDFQKNVYQENLFGMRTLDPVNFAKSMGYKSYRSLVNKKHSTPYQFSILSPKQLQELQERVQKNEATPWDTLLCNALYKLFRLKIVYSKEGKTPNGLVYDKLTELKVFKSLQKFYHPVTKKIYYEYELDEAFINNMARYFFKINLTVFTGLRKAGLQDLYLKMISVRDKVRTKGEDETANWLTFDGLCEFADTHCDGPKDNKKYLNKAFKKMNELTGEEFVSLTWKKNGKFDYKPILTFPETNEDKLDRKAEQFEKFHQHLFHNLKKYFRELHPFIETPEDFKFNFAKWLREGDKNYEIKQKAFITTYVQCWGKEIDRNDNIVFNYIRDEYPKFSNYA